MKITSTLCLFALGLSLTGLTLSPIIESNVYAAPKDSKASVGDSLCPFPDFDQTAVAETDSGVQTVAITREFDGSILCFMFFRSEALQDFPLSDVPHGNGVRRTDDRRKPAVRRERHEVKTVAVMMS